MEIVSKLLWGVATVMLFGAGLYFTFKLGFVQFKLKDLILSFKHDKQKREGITPFETLNIALASRIGVGSLAGVSLALYLGGVGTIFWMWISAIVCSANAFSESVLGVLYRQRDKENMYKGGPSYYISNGLGNKALSKIYAIVVLSAYIVGFLTIQANTIVSSITDVFNIDALVVAIFIVLITSYIIFSGLRKIAAVASKLVPIMSIGFIIISIYIIITNVNVMPNIISTIISEAFNIKALSFGVLTTMIIGIQRGIFSNEAGIGSGAIASSVADTDSPVKQGFVQLTGVYFTTLVICTLTALVVLSSNYQELVLVDVNGIEITQYAFSYHIGNIGKYVIMISIILFAFSTIISGYFYGESNLKFLFKNINRKSILLFKIIVLILLLLGSISSALVIWNIVDIFVVLMAIINVYAIFLLRKDVIEEYQYYLYKKRAIIKNR